MERALPLDIPAEQLADFCRRNQVQELALFGSAASGIIVPESDIDLMVTFLPEARVGLLTLARMQRELGELLGCRVDLVPKGGLKPIIRDHVLASARVLYKTEQICSRKLN